MSGLYLCILWGGNVASRQEPRGELDELKERAKPGLDEKVGRGERLPGKMRQKLKAERAKREKGR